MSKVLNVLLCLMLLCFGLFQVALADHVPSPSDVMKTDSTTDRQGFQADDNKQLHDGMGGIRGAKHIKGELFRVEGDKYFVQVKNGAEVCMQTDKTTVMTGDIKKGERVEAKINDKNHALSIRVVRRTDAHQGYLRTFMNQFLR